MSLNRKQTFILGGILAVILIVFVVKILSNRSAEKPVIRPLVVLGNLKQGDAVRTESLTGDILPMQQANIFSKVGGNLEKVFVDIGDHVSQNQVLALVDTTIYTQNAKQAKANYMQAVANYNNAKLNYERNKKLLDQKLISQQDFDNAKVSFDVATAQKEATDAVYNNAVIQLNYCKITAPFSGTITKRMLDPGAYVTASSNSQSSTVFTLMDIDHLKINVNIPERSVPYLRNVKEVIVKADALPDQFFKGKINKVSEAVDLSTRTMAVEVGIENVSHLLKPGMFATVQFILERKTNAELLPNQVVLNDERGDYVYVLNPDTTVSRKYVNVGIRMDSTFEILSGLNPSDKVVVVGQTLVKNNSKVKIVK